MTVLPQPTNNGLSSTAKDRKMKDKPLKQEKLTVKPYIPLGPSLTARACTHHPVCSVSSPPVPECSLRNWAGRPAPCLHCPGLGRCPGSRGAGEGKGDRGKVRVPEEGSSILQSQKPEEVLGRTRDRGRPVQPCHSTP